MQGEARPPLSRSDRAEQTMDEDLMGEDMTDDVGSGLSCLLFFSQELSGHFRDTCLLIAPQQSEEDKQILEF